MLTIWQHNTGCNLYKSNYFTSIETLRKWPPLVVTDRVCTNTYTIQPEQPGEVPVTLKKDDAIWIPIYAIHRDPANYPDPDKFDPERFNDENKRDIKPMSFIPFGVGPRNCIGMCKVV